MNEAVILFAGLLASVIGVYLIQGIKKAYQMVTGEELAGKPALWVSFGVAVVLALAAVVLAGAFNPPYPADPAGWIARIGAVGAAFFTAMTLIYKQFMATPAAPPPAPAGNPEADKG